MLGEEIRKFAEKKTFVCERMKITFNNNIEVPIYGYFTCSDLPIEEQLKTNKWYFTIIQPRISSEVVQVILEGSKFLSIDYITPSSPRSSSNISRMF